MLSLRRRRADARWNLCAPMRIWWAADHLGSYWAAKGCLFRECGLLTTKRSFIGRLSKAIRKHVLAKVGLNASADQTGVRAAYRFP